MGGISLNLHNESMIDNNVVLVPYAIVICYHMIFYLFIELGCSTPKVVNPTMNSLAHFIGASLSTPS